ncbi:MAG TPA: hypothetical protein VFA71_07375 [Terriglobales bacterium]|nr:hypothetical protein [Terriglobales bacterium]
MEEHLRACEECGHLRNNVIAVENKLQLAGKRLRNSFPLNQDRTRQAVESCIESISKTDAAVPNSTSMLDRLTTLRAFMTPLCGSGTVTRALRAAAQRTAVPSPEALPEVLWPDFMENLSAITGVLCGDPAAVLVAEVGRLAS